MNYCSSFKICSLVQEKKKGFEMILRPLCRRVRLSGMKIIRPPVAIGHYKMIKHKGDRGNEQNPRR